MGLNGMEFLFFHQVKPYSQRFVPGYDICYPPQPEFYSARLAAVSQANCLADILLEQPGGIDVVR
jgi:hypothetical protein